MIRKNVLSGLLMLCSIIGSGQTVSFEHEVPSNFIKEKGGRLALSDTYYKDGKRSLKWDFLPGSEINVALDKVYQLDQKKRDNAGIYFWVYNEKAEKDSITVEFFTPQGETAYRFAFRLFSKGWRACWIGFKHMNRVKETDGLAGFRIMAPQRKGRVFLDRLTFPVAKVNDRTTPDYQMPHNNSLSYRDLWHWCRVWQWEMYDYDLELPGRLTQQQRADLQLVEQRMDLCFQLGKNYQKAIEKAYSTFERAGIRRSGKGFVGKPLVAPDERNKKEGELIWEDVETMLAGFAYDVLTHGNPTAREHYFRVWDYAIDQGMAWGSGMGTNHHYGYQVRLIYITAWLMREEIYHSAHGKEILDALSFWSALQETRKACQYGRDELLDSWHTLLQPKMIAAMMERDECKRYRAMQGLTRWVATSLNYTPGTIGGIKVDGTTFHHGGFYPAYTTGVLAGIGQYIHLTDATAFEPADEAKKVLQKAFLAMRNYSNLHEWGIGLGGRHPFGGKMRQDDIDAFAYLALAGDLSGEGKDMDYGMAADYLRLCEADTPEKRMLEQRGIKPAAAPEGMFVYNYGAAGIYRRNNWMVTLKGYNTDVWGSEIYKKDNRYGRYQSYGSVQIFNGPSRKESGYDENGWDWNRLPGTTTIHLPWELLDAPAKGTMMVHSAENFAGCSSLGGTEGMFAMKLMERRFKTFTPDFVARKSVFCLGNRLICLGSGISNSNTDYPTETTLLQSVSDGKRKVTFGGEAVAKTGYRKSVTAGEGQWVKIEDGYGNVYYVKEGRVTLQSALQESRHEKTREVTHGEFVSAWIDHGKAPKNGGYEYVVCIEPEKEDDEAVKTSYRVVRKDQVAHIVKDVKSGTTGYAAFEQVEPEEDDVVKRIGRETMVMMRQEHDGLRVSVCDPNLNIAEKAYTTKEPSRIINKEIELKGEWKLVSQTDHVCVNIKGKTTVIKISCQHGIPVEFKLRKLTD